MTQVKKFDQKVKDFVTAEVTVLLKEADGPADAWNYAHEIAEDAITKFSLNATVDDFEGLLRELIFTK